MSSELIRIVRCDVCGRDKATEHVVTLDGQQAEVDLCLEDSGPLEALQSLLDTHGRRPRKKRAPGASAAAGRTLLDPDASEPAWMLLGRTCALCGQVQRKRGSLQSHLGSVHQRQDIAQVDREEGRVYACEQCPEEFYAYRSIIQHQRAHLAVAS